MKVPSGFLLRLVRRLSGYGQLWVSQGVQAKP